MNGEKSAWRRRQAIQIASQLPENMDDALAVLEHARDLVINFLGDGFAREKPQDRLGAPAFTLQNRLHLIQPGEDVDREPPPLAVPEPIKA